MDEDEMLMRAIAMSLEEEEVVKEELGSINVQAPGEPLKKNNQAITFLLMQRERCLPASFLMRTMGRRRKRC